MRTANQTQPRTSILGEWTLISNLGRRLYKAELLSTGEPAYLRVLGSNASTTERERFLAAIDILSKNKDHFLSVQALRKEGECLLAVSECPAGTLRDVSLAGHLPAIVGICQQLAEGLQLIHQAGRIHGALCRDSVELVDADTAQIRLRDIGLGLEIGRPFKITRQPHLPPEVEGVINAAAEWDLYSFGLLGLDLMRDANGAHLGGPVGDALNEVFLACIAPSPDMRPCTLGVVQRRLLDISHLARPKAPIAYVPRPPKLPSDPRSHAARLTPVEAQWFVKDCLSDTEVAAIEGFSPERMPKPIRVVASLLSVTAGAALALVGAAIFGLQAFGF